LTTLYLVSAKNTDNLLAKTIGLNHPNLYGLHHPITFNHYD
jgi:hypothetical protein